MEIKGRDHSDGGGGAFYEEKKASRKALKRRILGVFEQKQEAMLLRFLSKRKNSRR